jgi:hypothetical protein
MAQVMSKGTDIEQYRPSRYVEQEDGKFTYTGVDLPKEPRQATILSKEAGWEPFISADLNAYPALRRHCGNIEKDCSRIAS